MKRLGLKYKMIVLILVSFLGLVTIIGTILAIGYASKERKQLEHTLTKELQVVSYASRVGLEFGDTKTLLEGIDLLKDEKEFISIKVLNADGKVCAYRDFKRIEKGGKFDLFVVSIPVLTIANVKIGEIQAVATERYFKEDIKNVFSMTLTGTLFILFLILSLVVVLINKLIMPLIRLKATIDNASENGFVGKADVMSDDELGDLAISFNKMSERIFTVRAELIHSKEYLEDTVKARTKLLEKEKQKAEQASRAKSQFLANMSHEIRTPMNAIIGFSDVLQSTALTDDQKQYTDTIKNSGDLLLALINDILDISKIEADSLQLEKITFDLEYLVGSLLKIILVKVQDKNIDLLFEYPPGTPKFFMGDPTRIRQIILNLLGNAVKFTEQGEIKVTVNAPEPHAEIGGLQTVRVSVQDTGIGIPLDKQEKVFELFSQADESTTRKFGGTGLGLSIARVLSQKMGGDIKVSSQEGHGSEFIVTFQLNIAKPVIDKDISLVKLSSLKDKTIAIVDDNAHGLSLIEKYCKDAGLDIVFLGNRAQKLLSWLEEGQVLPEIIILDIMMPEMDGKTLAKHLRAEQKYKTIKLIGATSDSRPGTADEVQKAGFDAYLSKPIIRQELIKIIQAVLGDKREDKEIITRHIAEELLLKGMRVLIVEDLQTNRQLMKVYMDMFGCISDFANNGQEAIEKVRNNSYDVCLMDLQMPVMGGIEAAEIIRKDINKNIPIIALTAAAMKEDKEKCLRSGMDDYLAKPIAPKKLKELLYKWGGAGDNS